MSTSKVSVAMNRSASVTQPAATTSNPFRTSCTVVNSRMASSSSTSSTLCDASVSWKDILAYVGWTPFSLAHFEE